MLYRKNFIAIRLSTMIVGASACLYGVYPVHGLPTTTCVCVHFILLFEYALPSFSWLKDVLPRQQGQCVELHVHQSSLPGPSLMEQVVVMDQGTATSW